MNSEFVCHQIIIIIGRTVITITHTKVEYAFSVKNGSFILRKGEKYFREKNEGEEGLEDQGRTKKVRWNNLSILHYSVQKQPIYSANKKRCETVWHSVIDWL